MKTGNCTPAKKVPRYTPPVKPQDCEPHQHKERKKVVNGKKLLLTEPKDWRQEQLHEDNIEPILQAKEWNGRPG